jgi:regulation of enolase protein 1 (concanavalin A-like superfamily)
VRAGGEDIWNTSDQFHFVHQARSGDFDVAVRIESLGPTHLYTKAGLMVREALTADSRNLFFVVFPDNAPRNHNTGGYELQYRAARGGGSVAIYPPQRGDGTAEFPVRFPDVWLRLRRRGDTFAGFASADGVAWKLYAAHTLPLPAAVAVGVAVTSHDPAATTMARCGPLLNLAE